MEKRFYGMQNDYMFRAVLQKSRPALKSLLCALLHLDEAEIVSVEIMNPIELGETIDGKTCMLDVKVELNKNKVINIELQIQRLYTDKFCIRILDLTKMEMADEDTQKDILQWARMIKAESREEMDAIAEGRQVFEEVAELVKVLNNDKKIREQCEARFFYECDMASMRAEGRAEGRTEGQTEIIGQFYHNGFSAEKIAEITGKQTEEVYAIIRRYDGVVV